MARFISTIQKEDVLKLPTVAFDGEIVVVDTPLLLRESCAHLMKQSVLGFDTESRPSFKKGVVNKIALLQLSTERICFLFRLCRVDFDKHILKILENKDIAKIGLSVSGDIRELETLQKFRPKGFIDIQKVAPEYGIEELSLIKIAAIVLGKRVSKAQRLSNWESVKLTDAQKLYAATDAWVCTQIYNELKATEI